MGNKRGKDRTEGHEKERERVISQASVGGYAEGAEMQKMAGCLANEQKNASLVVVRSDQRLLRRHGGHTALHLSQGGGNAIALIKIAVIALGRFLLKRTKVIVVVLELFFAHVRNDLAIWTRLVRASVSRKVS